MKVQVHYEKDQRAFIIKATSVQGVTTFYKLDSKRKGLIWTVACYASTKEVLKLNHASKEVLRFERLLKYSEKLTQAEYLGE